MGAAAGMQKPPATAIYGYNTTGGAGMSKVTGYQPTAWESSRQANGLQPGQGAPLMGNFTLIDGGGKTSSISAIDYAAQQTAALKAAGSPKGIAPDSGLYQNLLQAQTGSNLFPGQKLDSYIATPGGAATPSQAPAAGPAPSAPPTPQAPAAQTPQVQQPATTGKTQATTKLWQFNANTPDWVKTMASGVATTGGVAQESVARKKKARGNLFGNTLVTGGNGLIGPASGAGKTLFGQ